MCNTLDIFVDPVFMHKKCVPNSKPFVETDWFRKYFCVCQLYFVVKFIMLHEDFGPECVAFRVTICHSRSIALYILNERTILPMLYFFHL